jgi:hypothetical protein
MLHACTQKAAALSVYENVSWAICHLQTLISWACLKTQGNLVDVIIGLTVSRASDVAKNANSQEDEASHEKHPRQRVEGGTHYFSLYNKNYINKINSLIKNKN